MAENENTIIELDGYQLAWHPAAGSVRFKAKGSSQWTPWQRVSAADLAAIGAIFNQTPVYYDRRSHAIGTGPEMPGDIP